MPLTVELNIMLLIAELLWYQYISTNKWVGIRTVDNAING